MTPSFQDRWIAAQNAEDTARREQASAVMSGAAILIFLLALLGWVAILGRAF